MTSIDCYDPTLPTQSLHDHASSISGICRNWINRTRDMEGIPQNDRSVADLLESLANNMLSELEELEAERKPSDGRPQG